MFNNLVLPLYLQKQKRGSFLARSKEALAKIAEMTKPVANPSAGAKSSGKFTFAVISPEKESQQVNLQILKFQRVDLICFTYLAKPRPIDKSAYTGLDKQKCPA